MSDWSAAKFMGSVSFSGPEWSEEFSVEKLPSRIAFYKRMNEKYGHRTESYRDALGALQSLT